MPIRARYDDGTINWQRVADELNTQADSALVAAGAVGADEIAAQTIIRNSVNQHFWYGYLGTAEYHLSDIYKLTFGTDLRYYKGEHWREVRNLLGADYYVFEWDNNATTSSSDSATESPTTTMALRAGVAALHNSKDSLTNSRPF